MKISATMDFWIIVTKKLIPRSVILPKRNLKMCTLFNIACDDRVPWYVAFGSNCRIA